MLEPTESDVLAPDGPHAEPGADAATADGVATAIEVVTPDASRPAGEGLPPSVESATAAESPADVAAESNGPRRSQPPMDRAERRGGGVAVPRLGRPGRRFRSDNAYMITR